MATPQLLRKIQQIPPAYEAELEDFVDFILHKKVNTSQRQKKRVLGLLKGKLHMSSDFDAPLDEFKDYMQ